MSLLTSYKGLSSSKSTTTTQDVRQILEAIVDVHGVSLSDDDVRSLVQLLVDDLLSGSGRLTALTTNDAFLPVHALKSLGRTHAGADCLSTERNLSSLLRLFDRLKKTQEEAAEEVLRCVANTLTLVEDSRDRWAIIGGADTCLILLETSNSYSLLFLAARILLFVCASPASPFLPTLVNTVDTSSSVTSNHKSIVDTLISRIDYTFGGILHEAPMSREALTWILKYTSVVIHHWPNKVVEDEAADIHQGQLVNEPWSAELDPIVPAVLRVFTDLPHTLPSPLMAPLTIVPQVLTLCSINRRLYNSWLPSSDQNVLPQHVIDVFDLFELSLEYYFPDNINPDDDMIPHTDADGAELDSALSPLALFLIRLCVTDTTQTIKQYLLDRIIPSNLDRTKPLPSRSDTLGRCIRLMTSLRFELLKKSIGELLYVLCDSNAETMSLQIGYGNAAGFLYTRSVFAPPSAPSASSGPTISSPSSLSLNDQGNDDSTETPQINPISGMIMTEDDKEKHAAELRTMSDEEKEREAEKLFVLLERMEKAGLAENPLKKALAEGKLEKYMERAERQKADDDSD